MQATKQNNQAFKLLIYCLIILLICGIGIQAQQKQNKETFNGYQLNIDLLNVENNKVKVQVITPKNNKENLTYIIPISSYGGYEATNLKQWIENFTAYDQNNNPLPIKYVSSNGIEISYASKLHHIEYWIKNNTESKTYQSGLPHIRPNENYLLNHCGFFGYLLEYPEVPFEVSITKPAHLHGATSLPLQTSADKQTDQFRVNNYLDLFQNPIMYAEADTMSFTIGDTRLHIHTYSESGAISSRDVYYHLKPLCKAVDNFLEEWPVKDYHFVLYFAKRPKGDERNLAQYGGLMCASSSFYVMPEIKNAPRLKKVLQRVAAHELLHLLAPYSLHSENVAYFGLADADMTQHLWLYEGATEYLSLLMLTQNGLLSKGDFFEELSKKIRLAEQYPPISLTKMSKQIFKPKNQSQYKNLYYRGMLVAFMLDVELRDLSNNEWSLPKVIKQLAAKYGHDTFFEEEELFKEINALTQLNLDAFVEQYIHKKGKLPYNKYCQKMGMRYEEKVVEKVGSFGKFTLWPDFKRGLMTFKNVGNNALNIQKGDVLLTLNNTPITPGNFEEYKHLIFKPVLGKSITLIVVDKSKIKHKSAYNTDEVQLHAKLLENKPWEYKRTFEYLISKEETVNAKAKTLKQQLLNGEEK